MTQGRCKQRHSSASRRTEGAAHSPLQPSTSTGVAASICKRLHLYLRWMVRRDRVDPGGWDSVSAAKLMVPLDTHTFRIVCRLGATRRRSADMRAAQEATEAFRRVCPRDPVRYDFALSRLGIREEADMDGFLRQCVGAGGARA